MMNLRLNIFLTIALISLSAALMVSVEYGLERNRECGRLATNQDALTGQISRFTLRDSLQGASTVALEMSTRELRTQMGALSLLVDQMGIKLRRAESISQSAIASRYHLSTPLIDGKASVTTPHINMLSELNQGVLTTQIETIDTLTQVVHRVPKRFLFLRYGTHHLEQSIVSSNPNSRIVYSRQIKISK